MNPQDLPADVRAKREAEEIAKQWLVLAHKKLIADMDSPDDVMCAFEIAFVDGYLTGHSAGWAEGRAGVERLQKLADSQIAYATRLECELKAAKTLDSILSDNGEIVELEEKLTAADQEIEDLKGDFTRVDEMLEKANAEIAMLKSDNDNANRGLSTVSAVLLAAEAEIERLSKPTNYIHKDVLAHQNKKLATAREEIERLRVERDAYAKAMALALQNGIFANKASVKRAIEKIFADADGSK